MKISKKKQEQPDGRERIRAVSSERTRKVYSYYATSTQAEQPTERTPHKDIQIRRRLKVLPGVLAVAVIIGSIIYSFTLGSYPEVATLAQQASPYRNTEEYAQKVDEILRDNPMNRTKITIQTFQVEQALLDAYPELQDVVLRLPVLGRKPNLVVHIRQPAALLSAANRTYVLDVNGIAVSEASQISAEDKNGLPIIQDQSGIDIKLGKQVLTTETIQFVLDANYQLASKSFKISGLTLPISVNELDIRLEGLPYYVKTDATGNVREQIGSFIAVHDYLQEQGITPTEYIDVRVEEKVFYK